MKKLILVTSPPASGKTYISKALANALKHVVYLDKDTLIVLSNQIFAVAGKENNRSSAFFKENIRDYEYKAIVNIALEALQYDDIVLINAPFAKEIHSAEYMENLRDVVKQQGAVLYIIWVITSQQVMHQRMIERGSDRDTWKIAHWEEYLKTIDFAIPTCISGQDEYRKLLLFYNSTQQEYESSMRHILAELEQ